MLLSARVTLKSEAAIIIIKFVTKKRKNPEVYIHAMSLENVQLPAVTLQHLYRYSLISAQTDKQIIVNTTPGLKFLGGNRQGIILLVENKETTFLPGLELDFLVEILTACKLGMDDVALINISKAGSLHYEELLKDLHPKSILVFGIPLSAIGLPFKIPEFQVQSFDDLTYLSIPAIKLLQDNKELKRSLWICLKQIFAI